MTLGIVECAGPGLELQNWIQHLRPALQEDPRLFKVLSGNSTYALNRVDGR